MERRPSRETGVLRTSLRQSPISKMILYPLRNPWRMAFTDWACNAFLQDCMQNMPVTLGQGAGYFETDMPTDLIEMTCHTAAAY